MISILIYSDLNYNEKHHKKFKTEKKNHKRYAFPLRTEISVGIFFFESFVQKFFLRYLIAIENRVNHESFLQIIFQENLQRKKLQVERSALHLFPQDYRKLEETEDEENVYIIKDQCWFSEFFYHSNFILWRRFGQN